MELLLASFVGVLTACGVYLLLRPRTFEIVLGLTLLSYAVNLFLFAMGGCGSTPPRSFARTCRRTSRTTRTRCRRRWCSRRS